MTYTFLVVGWNCARWADRCLSSILDQRLPGTARMRVLVVDDASEDDTPAVLRTYRSPLVHLHQNAERRGAAYSRALALRSGRIAPADVVVVVDLDDYLPHDGVLTRLHAEYAAGAAVTYGSYQTEDPEDAARFAEQLPYDPGTMRSRAFRSAPWRCWHLRTFRYALLATMPPDYYFHGADGRWARKCTDLALMFCVMERAPAGTVRHIPDVLYTYNAGRLDNSLRTAGRQYKYETEGRLRSLPPLPPVAT